MKIQTKIPVTYNSGIASQETAIVEGEISFVKQDYLRDLYTFMFSYKTVSGEQVETQTSDFSLTKDKINAFYDVIKSGVPTTMQYFETSEYIYYLGFKIEMAKTFRITPNDIEIVL